MLDREFKFKPSQRYITLLLSVVVISVIIMLFLPCTLWIKLIGLIGISTYGGYVLWRYGWLRSQHSILGIKQHPDDSWSLYTPDEIYAATLCGDSTVTSVVSALRFQVSGQWRQRSCIIFRDSLEQDQYRRLLVVLKMG